jgi:phosphoenolpyruvate synthase/pyruvate phosphate dikinase
LRLPPGFPITTAADRRFVAEHGLQVQILAAVSSAAPDQPSTHEGASSRIGNLFAQHAIPDDIAEEISCAYFRQIHPDRLSLLCEKQLSSPRNSYAEIKKRIKSLVDSLYL